MSDRQAHGKALVLDEGAARLWLAYDGQDDRDVLAKIFKKAKRADLPSLGDNHLTRQQWAKRISDTWRKAAQEMVARIFRAGRDLIVAKDELDHGEFEAMIEADLPFRSRTAQRLMAIARDERLKATPVSLLPPSWGTLYDITRLSDEDFEHFRDSGVIHADMDREELAAAVAKRKRKPPPPPLTGDVKSDDLEILIGDCIVRLKEIPDASIDCVITSPPYFHTLVYPGSFTVFSGDQCCEHEWEMHSKNYGGWHQRTTGLNPRHKTKNEEKTIEHGTCKKCGAERVMLGWEETVAEYIDHLVQVFAEVKRVLKPGGVFWLNIADKCTDKDSLDVPERLLLALKNDGWRCAAKIIWQVLNKMPSSVRDRPNCDYEMVYMLVKQEDYYFDSEGVREPAKCADDPRRGKRVDYHGKYDGTTGFGQQSFASIREDGTRNLRSVWAIPSDRLSDGHFCPFPKSLIRRLILLGCPVRGVVCDPFGGSGTTGLVANALGRRAVLIEVNSQFAAEALERIERELEEYKAKCAQEDAWGAGDNDEMGEALELETAE